jgi:hypothetical protein
VLAHSDGVESERIGRACMVETFRVGVNWLCLHGRKSPMHVQGFVGVSLPALGGRTAYIKTNAGHGCSMWSMSNVFGCRFA